MVVPEEGIPALAQLQLRLPLGENPLQSWHIQLFGIIPLWRIWLEQESDMFKLEDHGQFLVGWIGILLGNLRCGAPGFAHRQEILVQEAGLVHFLEVVMELGTISCDFLVRNLPNQVNDIHPKTSHSLVNPAVHHIVNLLADLFVFPVQIWLFFTKEVEIILARGLIIFPGRARKSRNQSIGLISPDIVVPFGTG